MGVKPLALFAARWGLQSSTLFFRELQRVYCGARNDPNQAGDVVWLAVGVVLTIAVGSQAALLTSLRGVGIWFGSMSARACLAQFVEISKLWLWGKRGLLTMVLVAPAATFFLVLL
ncbi:hypothetical protein [Thermosynechococcus vestitus]|uniref:Tlr0238 protein n=1 Tax=Thermosynechococcus vestitus (strain NIES-2133 / IAM M-273 / BP-1) TaxID=197221 RepID=Q8DM83_THEVB|nr:hypothetical protein [Thermosynechococcus vestitus]BAC07791.1 tlr0238 [Thermosynechococcus vestitus BP-1]